MRATVATARGVNSAYAVPNGLTEAGTSVIVSEITYAFTPLLDLTADLQPRRLRYEADVL